MLNIGSALTTGLAKELYDELLPIVNSDPKFGDLEPADKAKIEETQQKMADAIAKAVITHFKDNAEVKDVKVNTGALMVGIPPLPPVVAPTDGGLTLFTSTLVPRCDQKDLNQAALNSGSIN